MPSDPLVRCTHLPHLDWQLQLAPCLFQIMLGGSCSHPCLGTPIPNKDLHGVEKDPSELLLRHFWLYWAYVARPPGGLIYWRLVRVPGYGVIAQAGLLNVKQYIASSLRNRDI